MAELESLGKKDVNPALNGQLIAAVRLGCGFHHASAPPSLSALASRRKAVAQARRQSAAWLDSVIACVSAFTAVVQHASALP